MIDLVTILEIAIGVLLCAGGLVISYKSSQFIFKRGKNDDENGGQFMVSRK